MGMVFIAVCPQDVDAQELIGGVKAELTFSEVGSYLVSDALEIRH